MSPITVAVVASQSGYFLRVQLWKLTLPSLNFTRLNNFQHKILKYIKQKKFYQCNINVAMLRWPKESNGKSDSCSDGSWRSFYEECVFISVLTWWVTEGDYISAVIQYVNNSSRLPFSGTWAGMAAKHFNLWQKDLHQP